MAEKKDKVVIHTDGSCLSNPGPGGWAAKLSSKGKSKFVAGGFYLTTNNRMEIYAAIMGLEHLTRPCEVLLYSDSQYLCNAVEKRWLSNWQKNSWRKSDKKPVLNRDLWEKLLVQLERHSVKFNWIRGHAGHKDNEDVDLLARSWAQREALPDDPGYTGEE